MILPFQNLRWCWTLLRILLITPGGLISNRRLSTLSTLLPQYHLFELNHVMIEIMLYHLYWASLRGYISLKGNHLVHICFDKGAIIDIFNVVFTPFYSLKPVLQAIYKFWVWKKKQGPWPKLEKCMKINTCKCIYMQGSYRVLNSWKSLKICPANYPTEQGEDHMVLLWGTPYHS